MVKYESEQKKFTLHNGVNWEPSELPNGNQVECFQYGSIVLLKPTVSVAFWRYNDRL